MTRVFTDGAEMGDSIFWDGGNINGAVTNPRTGVYSYRCWGGGNTMFKYLSPISECYIRLAGRICQAGNISEMVVGFYYDTTRLAYLYWDTSYYHIYIGSTDTIVLNTVAYQHPLWHVYEVHFKLDDSAGIFDVKIDGILVMTYSGDTKPDANTTFNRFYVGGNSGSDYDDLAMNDTSNANGLNDNSWCGDGRIYKMTPSGSSATTNNWVNSGGVSASANYLYVDEYPADGDTTYVYCSGSNSGNQDQYAMTNLGLSSTVQISRIWTETRAKKTDSSDTYIKLGVLPSGGTDSVSGSIPLTTNYTIISGCSIKTNPYTSASWTSADLDGLEAVIEMG